LITPSDGLGKNWLQLEPMTIPYSIEKYCNLKIGKADISPHA
jgi:hypothetical protein